METEICESRKKLFNEIDIRVDDLINQMTIEEKVRQMGMVNSRQFMVDGQFSPRLADEFFYGMGIGAVQDLKMTPEQNAVFMNELQDYLKKNTHLGIPALIIGETLHGVLSPETTVFPQAIGLGSTWNTGLIREVAKVCAKEARAVGINQALAPDLDLAREPRWGRTEETYGEDPYLCSRLGVAYVTGIQGDEASIDSEHMIATIKHFAAHGSPEGGVNLSPVPTGERQLRELYLPPFKAAVEEAGALSVMPAYSEIDGIPCSSSKFLLNRVLREEWGFQGYVFSDYEAIDMLMSFQHTADSLKEAGRQALAAGMDLEAPIVKGFGKGLVELVNEGVLPEKLIDSAVKRILRVKFIAGLFENPYADVKAAISTVNCKKHKDLALEAAHESIVLLENKKGFLPLDKKIKSMAIIGPNADTVQLGDYSIKKESAVTPLQGILNRKSPDTKIFYSKGCGLYDPAIDGFKEAIEYAGSAEVAVVVVGGTSMRDYFDNWQPRSSEINTCGEGFDRNDLGLPGVQQKLVEAVINTGTPTVVVIIDGRPSSIPWIAENANAVIEAWYPGEEGGNAIADILLGNVNPSGRLPVSFPRHVGQCPVYYNHKPSARGYYQMPGNPNCPGRDYVFMDTKPLYEFGYGLSYTTFEYSELKIEPQKAVAGQNINVSVKVENVGQMEGKEVVQLYINDLVSSVSTPVKALKRFEKISLKPKESKIVSFNLDIGDLSILDEYMISIVEPGYFEVIVGGLNGKFEVN